MVVLSCIARQDSEAGQPEVVQSLFLYVRDVVDLWECMAITPRIMKCLKDTDGNLQVADTHHNSYVKLAEDYVKASANLALHQRGTLALEGLDDFKEGRITKWTDSFRTFLSNSQKDFLAQASSIMLLSHVCHVFCKSYFHAGTARVQEFACHGPLLRVV